MKLIIDHHLSYKLVDRLKELFPDSTAVRSEGMAEADDRAIWEFAKAQHYTILTKDADFYDIGLIEGPPPQIIWLRCGNTSTSHIEKVLRKNYITIKAFIEKGTAVCLELY